MTKLNRLKKEALESCEFRGHKMKRFISPRHGFTDLTTAYAHCRICDRRAIVKTRPLPNEIEISGEAIALGCQ